MYNKSKPSHYYYEDEVEFSPETNISYRFGSEIHVPGTLASEMNKS